MTNKISNSNQNLPPIQQDEFLPPLGRWTTIGGLVVIGILAIVIPAMSVIKYKSTVRGQATVRPAGELRLVQATAEGPVLEISAKENQRVKQGDVIATIDSSRLETKKSQLQSSIQQAQLQISQINAQMSAQTMLATAEAGEAEADLRATQAAFSTAKSKRDRYEPIAAQGALSQNDLEEAQLAAEQQAQAVEAAQARVQRAKATLNKEQEALIQQRIELSNQLEQSRYELQQVETDLRQTTIKATSDGIITKLNLRNSGQTVGGGQEIAQIFPSGAPLQLKVAVSPDEIDKVKVGQTAQMRVSACPYPDYGVLNGKVSQVSQDTIKPSNDSNLTDGAAKPSSNATAPFYEVTVEPQQQALSQGKTQCPIQPGMEGRIDIVSREETVLQFLLRKARLLTDV